MKQKLLALLVTACSLTLTGCAGAPAGSTPPESTATGAAEKSAYHKITAQEAKEMIDGGNVTVVDVRTAEEYAEAHIPGAVLVPNESIGGEAPEALPDKDAVLVVHCRTGVRSKQASDKLVDLGYTNIYDMGGIVDWSYETESGAAQ